MNEQGFYWVKVLHFLPWSMAWHDGRGTWIIWGDENVYQNVDLNVIGPQVEEPST